MQHTHRYPLIRLILINQHLIHTQRSSSQLETFVYAFSDRGADQLLISLPALSIDSAQYFAQRSIVEDHTTIHQSDSSHPSFPSTPQGHAKLRQWAFVRHSQEVWYRFRNERPIFAHRSSPILQSVK